MKNMPLQKTFQQIKDLRIQGATAVARAVVLELKNEGLKSPERNFSRWQKHMQKSADYLLSARPTEPMAQNFARFLLLSVKQADELAEARVILRNQAASILSLIETDLKKIEEVGEEIIKNGDHILTHCHSSTVEHILVNAKKHGKKFKVFNTETRPLLQGHITARNLLKNKLDVTMVTDDAAAFLISPYSGRDLMMNKILLGADVISSNGAAVNKIGSLAIALAARDCGVPLYVVVHLFKVDDDGKVEIEKRPAREIWPQAPKGLKILNFVFDIIPPSLITGFITEFGILKPKEVKKVVEKNYPWLNK